MKVHRQAQGSEAESYPGGAAAAEMHEAIGDTVKWLQPVVRGYFQCHAIPGNEEQLQAFRKDVLRLWLRQLRRRSQRSRWTWARFLELLGVL